MKRTVVVGALFVALLTTAAGAAPLLPEQRFAEKLGAPSPHWIFVYDVNYLGYLDSKVYLFDADTGSMLGMLSTANPG